MSLSQTAEAAGWNGSRAVEGERERGSGEAVARKATLGQA